ncbi:hypothetical protein ACKKBG_A21765 [Auxenochlorella protothecoides x Auxenochlorella symbiontica]
MAEWPQGSQRLPCLLHGPALHLLWLVMVFVTLCRSAETVLTELPPALDWAYNRTDVHKRVNAYAEQFRLQNMRGNLAEETRVRQTAFERLRSPVEGESQPRDLVVVAGGDDFDPTKWTSLGGARTWDLIWIYYGNAATIACAECSKVYRGRGPKWRLAWRLTLLPEWETMRSTYKAIAFLDDDLIMADVGVLNTAFAAVTAFRLLLAQPSVCRAHWSFTPYETLRQRDESILRYTNLVEIMAPIFDMDFFDELVRLTLYNAHYGWGLDWIWPDLLGYPSDKIAVIDEVCLFHPESARFKRNSLYKVVAPYTAKEEEARRFSEWRFDPNVRASKGFSQWSCDVVGIVKKGKATPTLIAAKAVVNVVAWRLLPFYGAGLAITFMIFWLRKPRVRVRKLTSK